MTFENYALVKLSFNLLFTVFTYLIPASRGEVQLPTCRYTYSSAILTDASTRKDAFTSPHLHLYSSQNGGLPHCLEFSHASIGLAVTS